MRPVQSITGVIRGWPVKIVWIEERTGRDHMEGREASGRERRMDIRAVASPHRTLQTGTAVLEVAITPCMTRTAS